MVQTFATNASNDIYIAGDGNLAIFTGIEAVEGACVTRSKSQLGEMIYATGSGLPNFQSLWIGKPNIPAYEGYLRSNLLNVSGVNSIKSLSSNASNNTLTYTATIITNFGEVTING